MEFFNGNPSYLSFLRTLNVRIADTFGAPYLMPISDFSHSYGGQFYGSSDSPGSIVPEAERYRVPFCVLPLGLF